MPYSLQVILVNFMEKKNLLINIIIHVSQVVGLHTLEHRVCQWSGLSMYASVNGHQRSFSYGSAHELSLSSVNP